MGDVAARQHPIARLGRRGGATLVLIGLAALAAAYVLPLVAPAAGRNLSIAGVDLAVNGACCAEPARRLLPVLGRLFVAAGVAAAVLAALVDRLIPLPSAAVGREPGQGGGASPAPPLDLSAAPEAIRDLVAAARRLGYEAAPAAPGAKALTVQMKAPLEPEHRQMLIQQFPTLGRWYFSGNPEIPPEEGFRDAESGAAISFPIQLSRTER
jgi:hypothetical protein